jgi:hypothetical protein
LSILYFEEEFTPGMDSFIFCQTRGSFCFNGKILLFLRKIDKLFLKIIQFYPQFRKTGLSGKNLLQTLGKNFFGFNVVKIPKKEALTLLGCRVSIYFFNVKSRSRSFGFSKTGATTWWS